MLRVPNAEILLPGIVLQAACNFYNAISGTKAIYGDIAYVTFWIGLAIFLIGLFFFLLPFFDGRKTSEVLKNFSEISGYANIGIYPVLAGHYIETKWHSASIGYSWFVFILTLIYMMFYLICWCKYYKFYKINLTLIGPYLLLFNPSLDLWDIGHPQTFTIFKFTADFIWEAMRIIIVYNLIVDPTKLHPIVGIGAFMICHYIYYTFLPLLLAIPLTYVVFLALKNKTLDADMGIVAFTAYWVAFAVLIKDPLKTCYFQNPLNGYYELNEQCDKAREVFAYIGHIFSWVSALVLVILMIPSAFDSPLDAIIKSPHEEHPVLPQSTKVTTTTTTITMPTENVDDVKVVIVNQN